MNLFSRYALVWCVILYMAGIATFHAAGLFPRPGFYDLSRLAGSSQVVLEGQILDGPTQRWGQTRFLLEGRISPLTAFRGKCIVTLGFPVDTLGPGDLIRVRGWISRTRHASAARPFDEYIYWETKEVFSKLKVWSPEGLTVLKSASQWSLDRAAWEFHKRYRAFWEKSLPREEASLLLGITVGARGVLPRHVKDACIRAGVYHIVVVSGQNMSLIVALGVGSLALFRIPRRRLIWISWGPILFYTSVVGSDPPVVRAAVTAVAGLLILALGRDVPRYYPLLLAAAWILLQDPAALLGASFQLSFGATLSILALLPFMDNPSQNQRRWRRWLMEAGLMGLCVHLGIWPILVYYFHRLSLAGFLANWTIFPLSGALMIAGLLVGTWGVAAPQCVPPFLTDGVGYLLKATLALIFRMASWKHAVVPVGRVPPWLTGVYYAGLFGILFMLHRRKIYGQALPKIPPWRVLRPTRRRRD